MPDHQSTPDEMLAYWKSLVGDESPNPWKTENMGMFFQAFRPYGEGVAAAFDGVVGADEMLPRLMQVYEATADGWGHDGAMIGTLWSGSMVKTRVRRARAPEVED